MKNIKSIVAGVLAVFIWAVIPCLVKTGTETLSIPLLIVLRFLVASSVMLYWLPGVIKKMFRVKGWLWLLLLLDLGANYYFQSIAMKQLPVSWYIVIFSLNPILSLFFLKVPFNKNLILSIALSMMGTLCFLNWSEEKLLMNPLTLISLMIGMLTWVIYTLLVKKFQNVYNDIEITTLTNFNSLIAALIIWSMEGFKLSSLSATSLIAVTILGVGTVLAYIFYSYCLRRLPAFGILSQYLEPVFGIGAGYIMYHETLSIVQYVGAATIVLAMSRVSLEA